MGPGLQDNPTGYDSEEELAEQQRIREISSLEDAYNSGSAGPEDGYMSGQSSVNDKAREAIEAAKAGNLRDHLSDKTLDEIKKFEDAAGITDKVKGNNLSGDENRESKTVSEALREMEERRKNGENISDADNFYKETSLEGKRGPKKWIAMLDNRRKKAVAGSMVLAVAGTIAAVTGLSTGPAKLIYMSDVLQDGHFFTQEDMGATRMFMLTTKVRYAINSPEKLRLGIVGNLYADKLVKNMKSSGFDIELSDKIYQNKSIVFDPAAVSDNDKLKDLKNQPIEASQEYMRKNYGMEGRIEGNRLVFDTADLSNAQTKRIYRGALKASGYANVAPTGRARLLAKRGGSYGIFHPIKKADEAILNKLKGSERYKSWQKSFNDRVNKGTEKLKGKFQPEEKEKTNPDGSKTTEISADDADAAKAADDLLNTEVTADSDGAVGLEEKTAATSGKLSKLTKASSIAGAVCLVQGISNNIDDIRQNNLVLPLMRLGMEMVSVGQQLKSGQDVNYNQAAYYSMQLANETKDYAKNWANDKSFQYEAGKAELNGSDIPAEIQFDPSRNAVSKFLNIEPLNTICDTMNSPVGFVGTAILDISTGPLGALAGFVLSSKVGDPLIKSVSKYIAGDVVNVADLRAAALTGGANHGVRMAASESFAAAAAAPISPGQSTMLRKERLAIQRDEFSRLPIAQRLFDKNNYKSLVARASMSDGGSSNKNMFNSIASSMMSPFANVASAANNVVSTSVLAEGAQEQYDYGYPELSYTYEEINDPDLSNPYDNASKVNDILQSSDGDEYIERLKTCFNIDLDKEGNVDSESKTVMYSTFEDHPECGGGDTSQASSKPQLGRVLGASTNKDWLRVRMYVYDTQLLSASACFDQMDIDKVCSTVGMGADNDTVGTDASDTSVETTDTTSTLPSGDSKELAQKLLDASSAGKVGLDATEKGFLNNLAAGKGPCPNVAGGLFTVDPKLLAVLLALSENNTYTISSLHRGCENSTAGVGKKSRHWKGKAADISGSRPINGATMGGSFANYSDPIQKFINNVKTLLPAGCELGVPNDKYKSSALGVSSGCTNVFLDTPGTTGATGPHVHIGVPL